MSAPPCFAADIERQHLRLNAADWDDIYVVGDVHGCRRELDDLLDRLAPTEDDLVVFVGDLVRKGPDNHGVVERVRGADNLFSIRGNNEEKVLRGEKTVDDLTENDVDWIRSLPVAISFGDALVVHGGVDPRMDLTDHDVDDLQNTRSLVPDASYERPFWWDRHDGPWRVFFGHTPLAAPVVRRHAVGLDTGCVYGGELTAFDYRRDELVVHESDRTVVERDDSKFVRPLAPLVS